MTLKNTVCHTCMRNRTMASSGAPYAISSGSSCTCKSAKVQYSEVA
jgi:hypothetical protein